jgi:hypothetical protein
MAEDDRCAPPLLKDPPRVVNVGLEWFYRSLQSQGAKTVHAVWRPPAGGNQKLAVLLDRLSGRKLGE